jgi:hypothetical protein
MSLPAATLASQSPNALLAFVWGGLACGVLDITAALVVYGSFGLKPVRLLQGIAGGLLGPRTYNGGIATALLGLVCHFVIAFSAAAVFVAASRVAPFLVRYAVLSGALYGIAVYFFMNRGTALRRYETALFRGDDAHWRSHPHILRGPPDSAGRTPIRSCPVDPPAP